MGGKTLEQQEEQQQIEKMQEQAILGTSSLPFEEKIMGGQTFNNFMEGKIEGMDNVASFNDKVSGLTTMQGKGFNFGNLNIKGPNIDLGMANKSKVDVNNFLSFNANKKTNNKHVDVNKFLNFNNNKTNMFMGNNIKKDLFSKNNNTRGMMQMAPFNPLKGNVNVNKKVQSMIGSNPFNKGDVLFAKNNAKNDFSNRVNQSLGIFNKNPAKKGENFLSNLPNYEQLMYNRVQKQKGMSLFGDYDGDGVPNIFDANPAGRAIHKILGDKYSKNMGLQLTQEDLMEMNQYAETPIDVRNFNAPTRAQLQEREQNFNTEDRSLTLQRVEEIQNQINELQRIIDEPLSGEPEQRRRQKDSKETARKRIVELRQLQRQFQEQGFREQKFELERQDAKELRTERELAQIKAKELELQKLQQQQQLTREQLNQQTKLQERRIELEEKKQERQESVARIDAGLKREQAQFDRSLALRRQSAEEQKGDLALWGTKLEQAKTMTDNLTGFTGGKGFAQMAGLGQPSNTGEDLNRAAFLAGAGSGANLQNIAMLSGSNNQRMGGFTGAVNETLGPQTAGKSFSQAVMETLGSQTPEQLMEQRRLQDQEMQRQLLEQQMMQQQSQMQRQPPMQQSQMQRQQFVEQEPEQTRQREPEQRDFGSSRARPVKVDEQYAEYLQQSEATYRRGPYRKRR